MNFAAFSSHRGSSFFSVSLQLKVSLWKSPPSRNMAEGRTHAKALAPRDGCARFVRCPVLAAAGSGFCCCFPPRGRTGAERSAAPGGCRLYSLTSCMPYRFAGARRKARTFPGVQKSPPLSTGTGCELVVPPCLLSQAALFGFVHKS